MNNIKLSAPAAEYTPIDEPNAADPVLCYVDGVWAYFTTRKLSEQDGDDWNDTPYEHNAGAPYEPYIAAGTGDGKGGWKQVTQYDGDRPGWRIVRVAYWGGGYETPASYNGSINSPWSVDAINAGVTPWLKAMWSRSSEQIPPIMAGTPMSQFCRMIRDAGGKVYTEANP